jgi:ABC-type transport system involved in multi-copper enzyme maturation permease subunit
MTARLAKEIRQLAPWPLAATILLFSVPPFLGSETAIQAVFLIYHVVAVFGPAARIFGAEFDERTIERLLSQPIARVRIWREKLLALALTTTLALAALQLARSLFLVSSLGLSFDHLENSSGLDLVMCLVAFTGGPLVSLYARQSFLALWGAMSLPGAAIWAWLFLVYLALGHFHVGFFWVHIPPMILYIPSAYVAGRRLFLNLELDQASSRSLGLPRWFRVNPGSTFGPTVRLLLKEIQIQASNLLMIPAILVVWGVIYGLALDSRPGSSWLGPLGILHVVPAWLLIFVYPLALGATAVASERQMGLADWHASLPVPRARQWWVKVAVVMCLAAVGPLLAGHLHRMLSTVLESRQIEAAEFPGSAIWISILAAAAGVYASSRAREPFRAAMVGVALFVLTLLPATSPAALQIRGSGLSSFFFPGSPGAELFLGAALPTLALLSFAFESFRPEPWHWEKSGGWALRWLVLGGLFLTIGFW